MVFGQNNAKYEKMFSKIVHLKKIYKGPRTKCTENGHMIKN